MEWFISRVPKLLNFEVRKTDPYDLLTAIETSKTCEKSALHSDNSTEKKVNKKVRFVEEDSDIDDMVGIKTKIQPSTGSSSLVEVVKEEMHTMKQALEDVKVRRIRNPYLLIEPMYGAPDVRRGTMLMTIGTFCLMSNSVFDAAIEFVIQLASDLSDNIFVGYFVSETNGRQLSDVLQIRTILRYALYRKHFNTIKMGLCFHHFHG